MNWLPFPGSLATSTDPPSAAVISENKRQADSRTRLLITSADPVEPLEDLSLLVMRNTDAGVGHGEYHLGVIAPHSGQDLRRRIA